MNTNNLHDKNTNDLQHKRLAARLTLASLLVLLSLAALAPSQRAVRVARRTHHDARRDIHDALADSVAGVLSTDILPGTERKGLAG